MPKITEVTDLREKPIESLTVQEIKSRMHLITDATKELHKEINELNRMYLSLETELGKRG